MISTLLHEVFSCKNSVNVTNSIQIKKKMSNAK